MANGHISRIHVALVTPSTEIKRCYLTAISNLHIIILQLLFHPLYRRFLQMRHHQDSQAHSLLLVHIIQQIHHYCSYIHTMYAVIFCDVICASSYENYKPGNLDDAASAINDYFTLTSILQS
uniref:Uncharacterized protein n=1 Tax=Kalanchoe fedtschenkoi TaxID=63787 RepID=A0A7N0RD26_KALFE